MINVPTEVAFSSMIRDAAKECLTTYKFSRVENGVENGMPDIYGIFNPSRPVWVELKTAREPKNSDSLLFGTRARGLDVEQENWIWSNYLAGGSSYVAICTDMRVIVIDDFYVLEVNKSTVPELIRLSEYNCRRPMTLSDWEEFFQCLF